MTLRSKFVIYLNICLFTSEIKFSIFFSFKMIISVKSKSKNMYSKLHALFGISKAIHIFGKKKYKEGFKATSFKATKKCNAPTTYVL